MADLGQYGANNAFEYDTTKGRKTQKIPFQRHAFPEQPHNQWPYMRHDKAKPALANSAPHGEEPVRRCEFCGTSKTPQWREGPNGPKTLCNACGVKRGRQKKQEQEARAAEGLHGPIAIMKKTKRRDTQPPVKLLQKSFRTDSTTTEQTRDSLGAAKRATGLRRPIRKAAEIAAIRTAEFASTGDWPVGEEAVDKPGHRYRYDATSQSISSERHSDSAEELPCHWKDPDGELCAGTDFFLAKAFSPSTIAQLGEGNAGALNLMILNRPNPLKAADSGSAKASAQPMFTFPTECEHESPENSEMFAKHHEALQRMSPAQHIELLTLKEQFDESVLAVYKVRAEVNAVASVMANKLKNARDCQQRHALAYVRLSEFLAAVEQQGPRHPTAQNRCASP